MYITFSKQDIEAMVEEYISKHLDLKPVHNANGDCLYEYEAEDGSTSYRVPIYDKDRF